MKSRTNRSGLLWGLCLALVIGVSGCVAPVAAPATGGESAADAATAEPVRFFVPVELSGAGATAGTNWRDGLLLAQEDINAAGGILGRQVELEIVDTQTDPTVSKSVIAKGLEADPYAVLGPLFSSSIIVNMTEAQRAEKPQIMGGEAANGVQGHVGLSVAAPVDSLQDFGKRFEAKYGRASDHNGDDYL